MQLADALVYDEGAQVMRWPLVILAKIIGYLVDVNLCSWWQLSWSIDGQIKRFVRDVRSFHY